VSTTRTVQAAQAGPVDLTAELGPIDLDVTVDPDVEYGHVTVTTDADTGPAADLVNSAVIEAQGRSLRVGLPRGSGTVNNVIHGSVVQVSGVRGGVNIVSGRDVTIGGMNIQVGNGGVLIDGDGYSVFQGGGRTTVGPRVSVSAVLPAGSNVRFASASGDLRTSGELGHVNVSTAAGDVWIDPVRTAEVSTAAGDVRIGHVAGSARIRTATGDVEVFGADGAEVHVRTATGDVTYGSNLRCTARTVTGDVTAVAPR
jgi:DUF4097 and DUF4098 domain-containing protein YvlB